MRRKVFRSLIAIALVVILVAGILPGFAAADDEDGNPVSIDSAKQVAVNQLNKLYLAKMSMQQAIPSVEKAEELKFETSSISEVFTVTKNGKNVYYIINLNPEGWVIVSADYVAYPIIGCSDTGSYSEEDHPPAFDAWMENVKEEIYQAITEKVTPLEEATMAWQNLDVPTEDFSGESSGGSGAVVQSIPGIIVGPLIKSKWSQGGNDYWLPWIPTYDKYCPKEKRKKCVLFVCWWEWRVAPTGCVATATAQVMRYWKWPPVGKDSNSYDPPSYSCTDTATHKCYGYGTRSVDFSKRYYNWDNMPLLVWNDEIALLMRDVGIAVEMDYKPGGSEAYNEDVATGLPQYFRYDSSAEIIYRGSTPYSQWGAKLKAELDAGRPIVYGGEDCSGGAGHSFICDGYALSEFFHFNWGWDLGFGNGWYLLGALTPLVGNFTCGQEGIFNLEPDYPPNVYVDDNYAKGASGGHAWGYDAFNNIQDGINMVARAGGGNVWVNPGSYSKITMKQGIAVVGVGGANVTIIGGGGGRAVTADNVAGATLHGFTITSGKADTGAAMYIRNCWVEVENCVFTDNLATNGGGGMYNANSSPTVTNCTFWGNNTGGSGGGMYNNNSSPTVTNCIFLENSADDDGGGMYNVNSSPTVTNCTFWGNSADDLGDGMLNSGSSSPAVTNCILWDSSNQIANVGGATPTITYCNVQGGYSGAGNTNQDPLLKDPGNGDAHLKPDSPCIDAGNNSALSIPFNDCQGDMRRIDDSFTPDTGNGTAPIVDMGADEYTPSMPVAGNDVYSVNEDQTLDVPAPGVLDNDSDPQQDPLTAVKDTDPTNGTLTLNPDGSFTYTPSTNFYGTDSFTYYATDGYASSNIATVTIDVMSVQDPSLAVEDGYSVDEDQTLNVVKPGVLDNDSDPDGDPITAVKDTDPIDGTLTFNANGSFEYTPNPDFSGIDSFTYHASDGQSNSDIVTVTITINPVNDAPVAEAGDPYTGTEGSPVEFTGSGADIDGDALQYRWDFEDDGTWDTDWSDSGTASQTWDDDWTGTARVQVSDGELTAEDTASVTIENVPPTAEAGPNQSKYWGLPVNFDGTVSDPSMADTEAGLQPTWTFGDGDSAAGLSVTHAYADPGTYTATLTATDKDGGIGWDTAKVTVNKRETSLSYTGDTTGYSALSAQLCDAVDAATAQLDGRTVLFTIGGSTIIATTNSQGIATAPPAPLMPGDYQVDVSFAEDSHYLASSAQETLTLTISAGKVTGGAMEMANKGRGGFNVQSDGTTVKGELQFKDDMDKYHASEMTVLGIALDGKSAWFAGVGKDGRQFIAYVEDNGEPGTNDVFKLWIEGTLHNSDGILEGGNIQIHK